MIYLDEGGLVYAQLPKQGSSFQVFKAVSTAISAKSSGSVGRKKQLSLKTKYSYLC